MTLIGIISILFVLYFFSALAGWVIKKIVFILKLEKSVSFLKFENNWDYLAVSNKITNDKHKFGDRSETQLDIKTKGDELFTGKFTQFILDKDNAVESVIIKEAYKFCKLFYPEDALKISEIKNEMALGTTSKIEHFENTFTYIYKRKITDHLFIINKGEIENIAIRYVIVGNLFNKWLDYSKIILSIISVLIAIFCFVNAFWDIGLFEFKGTLQRFIFSGTVLCNVLFLSNFFYSLLELSIEKKKARLISLNFFLSLLYSLLPYLHIFGNIRLRYLLLLMIFTFPILGAFKQRDNEENSSSDENDNISSDKPD